jgi:glc operon protein GlcG
VDTNLEEETELTSRYRAAAVVAALTGAALTARAQVAEQKGITIAGARAAISAAAEAARSTTGTAAIAVVDGGGNVVMLERLDGTFAAGGPISIGKARTAALFRKPTRFFEQLINDKRTAMVTVEGFTPLIGGVPIEIDGQIVGAIGVSGAASADDDERIAVAGARAVAGRRAAAEPVSYFERDQVAAAFAKGAPLLENGHYKLHASHRDGPGVAEVHTRDTDVIHVLAGTATLVTGGEVVDAKSTGPEEIRGASIRGGETRRLQPGDVVVVPNGVPHWFREVTGPLDYYVVKVGGGR